MIPLQMDPALQAIADCCREHPTAEKWVLLHTLAQGAALGERLAREGHPWLNLRFSTPRVLARGLAAPLLVREGRQPLHPAMGPALVGVLLHEPLGGGRPYFRRLAGYPGIARALWSALVHLRLSGLDARDLDPGVFVSRDKGLEMKALLAAYEAELSHRRLADEADILRLAAEGAPRAGGPVLHAPTPPWTVLEDRLIRRLGPASGMLTLPILAPEGLEAPARFPPGALVPPGGASSDADRLAWLFSPGTSQEPFRDGTLELFHAAGHDAEVHEALRRTLSEGLPVDSVEIALASPEPYTGLLRDACARLRIPLTLAEGLPLTHTRTGRALLGFCRWASADFPSQGLIRLLQSGDMDTGLEQGPSASQAARILLTATPAGGGRRATAQALLQQAFREEGRAAEADRQGDREAARRAREMGERCRQLARWTSELAALLPEGERVPPADVFRACLTFLRRQVPPVSREDAGAGSALEESLSALAAIPSPPIPLAQALREVAELLEGLREGASGARPGHLHASPLHESGWSGRERTFVLGLDQGALPGTAREHPVLLDTELERLGAGLATGGMRSSETLYLGASRLGTLGGRVSLSCATRDLRKDRELYPSSTLLQAFRLEETGDKKGQAKGYAALMTRLGPAVTRVPRDPSAALDEGGWWLAALRDAPPTARRGVLAAFPGLSRGAAARASSGLAPSAAGEGDPRSHLRAVSASALEELAECPYRFFLHRLLHLDPPLSFSEADLWLDPLTRGGLLHGILAEFLRGLRDAGERADPRRHGQRLRRMGEETLAGISQVLPPPSRHAEEAEREAFLGDLDAFLEGEASAPERLPVGLEVAFGQPGDPREELATREPVPLDLGGGCRFLLKGQIDRIDLVGAAYEVVDYKTGRPWGRERRLARFDGGTQLQHALYAMAAVALLARRDPGAKVQDSQYLFPTRRGRGLRLSRGVPDPGGLRDLLEALLDQPRAGRFPNAASQGTCARCGFQGACGDVPWALGLSQRQDPALEALRRAEATR